MIQDDDDITLSRWTKHYKEVKEETIADVIRMLSSKTLHSYDFPLSHLYFYFFTKDSEITGNSAAPTQSSLLSHIRIDIPIRYVERLRFMDGEHKDINLISEMVDACMQRLLTRLNATREYDFFDIVVPIY